VEKQSFVSFAVVSPGLVFCNQTEMDGWWWLFDVQFDSCSET